jgi:hypothetical protein
MAKTIILSDEYGWTASYGLFEWVVEFLRDASRDPATRTELTEILQHNLPGIDLKAMPEPRRREILEALREKVVPAAESSSELSQPEPERRFTVGHVKVLKLMADEVARTPEGRPSELTNDVVRVAPERSGPREPASRRIVVSDEYRWTASAELFDWVVRFLLDHVKDDAVGVETVAAVNDQVPDVDLRKLPEAGREAVLRALRERLPAAVDAGLPLHVHEVQRRSARGHIKVLTLMAEDVARSGAHRRR